MAQLYGKDPQTRLASDDVLATGGTLRAALSLADRARWTVAGIVLELEALGGRTGLGEVDALSTV